MATKSKWSKYYHEHKEQYKKWGAAYRAKHRKSGAKKTHRKKM